MSKPAKKSRRIFLHVDPLSEPVLRAVTAAGYVPVQVPSLDRVQIVETGIDVELNGASLDVLSAAALNTIRHSGSEWVHAAFSKHALALLQRATEAKQ